jgi:hypothetical protein
MFSGPLKGFGATSIGTFALVVSGCAHHDLPEPTPRLPFT